MSFLRVRCPSSVGSKANQKETKHVVGSESYLDVPVFGGPTNRREFSSGCGLLIGDAKSWTSRLAGFPKCFLVPGTLVATTSADRAGAFWEET